MRYYSKSGLELRKGTESSAGYDLPFYDEEQEIIAIQPGEIQTVKTGMHLEIPENHVGILDVRSHVGKLKIDLMCRIIDSDYRGDIKLMMVNHGDKPITIKRGEYIAQIIVTNCYQAKTIKVDSPDLLTETKRGTGGFGHTGGGING